jgi:hypothetical protein
VLRMRKNKGFVIAVKTFFDGATITLNPNQ